MIKHEFARKMKREMVSISSSSSESELSDYINIENELTDEDEEEFDEEDYEEGEEDDDSDTSSKKEENFEFLDKLDEYMNIFKIETDKLIKYREDKEDNFRRTDIDYTISTVESMSITDTNVLPKPVPLRNPNSRRNSMLPGSEMCNGIIAFNDSLNPNHNQMLHNETSEFATTDNMDNHDPETSITKTLTPLSENSPDLLIDVLDTEKVPEPVKELKTLILNNEAKQSEVKKIQLELDGARKNIKELETTMKIKMRISTDLPKNLDLLGVVIDKTHRKQSELEKKCSCVKTQSSPKNVHSKTKSTHEKKEDVVKDKVVQYQERLKNIEMIKDTAYDSLNKQRRITHSLIDNNKQMKNLKEQLKKEEKRKEQLEEELAEDQKKIHELQRKYNLTASKLKELQAESKGGKVNNISKTDHPDKEKNLLDVSARILHLDHVLKEKSIDLERTADIDEKEALRHEIRNLRRIRDCLIDEKCDLDEKFQKEKTLSTVEERKLLECGETIEAIDAMIEHKNEMICGRNCFDENQSQREKGERMLMERLAKLSEGEMKTLFYKYFLKVIDLKESSKTLEVQTADLENVIETQEWQIQALTNALKQSKLEAEKRIIFVIREYEQKLQAMYKHFAEETSSSGHETLDTDSELVKYKCENEILKKQLAQIKAYSKGLKPPCPVTSGRIPITAPTMIQGPLSPTTKVTKERNKLIIQKTTDRDKTKK
ncbi:kinesin-like protein costa [Hylaeus anthracinus]|uniref:kinesin-like protein costa n=1 Tax=Hylaeus anthracinus TaxID=313031 RepID=UPI0023B8B213|nr:kinesin-like protein costa [Hylaeus anthracinus]